MSIHDIWDEVGHFRGILHAAEEKYKNAQRAREEHENRKKPCEKCAEGLKEGWGRGWFCDYYYMISERVERTGRDVSDARKDLRKAEEDKEKREESNDDAEEGP